MEFTSTPLLNQEDDSYDYGESSVGKRQKPNEFDELCKVFDAKEVPNSEHGRVREANNPSLAANRGGEVVEVGGGGQRQRVWVKERSKEWWEYRNSDECPNEEFRKVFRMSKATFNMICDELDSLVMKKNTILRMAIPVRQRVAVCIYRLATGDPLKTVSALFGLGTSTCHKIVLEVCAAMQTLLLPKYIQWPSQERLQEIKTTFGYISGIPNVIGSIYTTHISIIAPKTNQETYYNIKHTKRNQKPSYSMTVQGLVDPRGLFTDVCIGCPGSLSDEQILETSAFSKRSKLGMLENTWVVGNSGYHLQDWILVPYTHQNLTWNQHAFNQKLSELQMIAKDAFMRLKGRWGCLQKRIEVKLEELPMMLGACCVLHNICEIYNEEMDVELRFDLYDDEMELDGSSSSSLSVNAIQARDSISHNLFH